MKITPEDYKALEALLQSPLSLAQQAQYPMYKRRDWSEPGNKSPPSAPHFWSLYLHMKSGGIECYADFDTQAEAEAAEIKLAAELIAEHEKKKLKLIDMSKLPRGTLVLMGNGLKPMEVFDASRGRKVHVLDHGIRFSLYAKDLRITEQKEFTYWGGGECPVPDGVMVDCACRCGEASIAKVPKNLRWKHTYDRGDVIGYRIIGVAEGWTDNPEEAA